MTLGIPVTATETAEKAGIPVASFDFSKGKTDLESLLRAGVHFGHLSSRRSPKMRQFVYETRKNIDIVDLEQTQRAIETAGKFLAGVVRSGKPILVVGMKKQTHGIVLGFAQSLGLLYMIDRFIGGTLTNFASIQKRALYLKSELEKVSRGEYEHLTKFEFSRKGEELDRLEKKMGGLKEMKERPGAIIIADAKEASIALKEATRMGVPVVAIVDTNADPSSIEYPIPGNDDAVSSLHILFSCLGKYIADAKVK
ncbi:MAG: 30S ribosomal protein S2 [Candidatus Moraniibacteriota bacterium]